MEELNLQDCYWVKGGPLSIALQRCHKLKSLNVIGCEVSKKAICSILKSNENLKILEWSLNCDDLPTAILSHPRDQRNIVTFCTDLNQAFKKLECLTITFLKWTSQLFQNTANMMATLINFGMVIICSELCLKKFKLQWVDIKESPCYCFEIAMEGNGVLYQNSDFSLSSGGSLQYEYWPVSFKLKEMLLTALTSQLNCGKVHSFLFPHWVTRGSVDEYISHAKKMENVTSVTNINLGALHKVGSAIVLAILSKQPLRYLNLTGLKFDGHLLQVVATSSPNLEVLNLHNCYCPELVGN